MSIDLIRETRPVQNSVHHLVQTLSVELDSAARYRLYEEDAREDGFDDSAELFARLEQQERVVFHRRGGAAAHGGFGRAARRSHPGKPSDAGTGGERACRAMCDRRPWRPRGASGRPSSASYARVVMILWRWDRGAAASFVPWSSAA